MWTYEKTVSFITEVKKNPALWDKQCKEFRNKSNKEASWNSIGKLFGINGNEASKRMKNLRDEYVKAQYKLASSMICGMDVIEVVGPEFKFINHLEFLKPTVRHRKHLSNAPRQSYSPQPSSPSPPSIEERPRAHTLNAEVPATSFIAAADESVSVTPGLLYEEDRSTVGEIQNDVSENSISDFISVKATEDVHRHNSNVRQSTAVPERQRKKLRLGDDSSSDISDLVMWVKNQVETIKSQRNDAIDAFCYSLSFKLRSVPETDRDRVMFQIESLVYNAKTSK